MELSGASTDPMVTCDITAPDVQFVDMPSVYPEYLTDVNIVACPSHQSHLSDIHDGLYNLGSLESGGGVPGYENNPDVEAARDSDIEYDEPILGAGTLYRLREGIERFMITDINNPAGSARAQSEIPVIKDKTEPAWGSMGIQAYSHVPGGGNVLYMDGHVQFVRYPGDFPISRCVALSWL
jgi:prepilin-type processing-associated H-X9-DG protein